MDRCDRYLGQSGLLCPVPSPSLAVGCITHMVVVRDSRYSGILAPERLEMVRWREYRRIEPFIDMITVRTASVTESRYFIFPLGSVDEVHFAFLVYRGAVEHSS